MRTLIASEFTTLDGVMEAPGGEPTHPHTGWAFDYHSEELIDYKLAETLAAETLLIGRVTYESFADAWPAREGAFADKMNTMPKLVASATLADPEWTNTTVIAGDVVGAVRRARDADGGPILLTGSCTLLHTLLEEGLVDELRLMVCPVTIGGGLPVFPESPDMTAYELADCRSFPGGVALLTYRVA